MTTLNLLWPSWAELVAHLRKKNVGSWKTIQKAAALLANRYGREQDARFARLAWEEIAEAKRTAARELWARPPHRIRSLRHLLALVLGLSALLSTAAPAAADDDVQVEEPGRLYKALGWAMFPASAGDFASTEYALAGGGSELNPLMQNRGVRIGGSVAFPFVANYLSEELRKDGHPKLALWFRIAVVGLKGYAVFHNLRAAP
jgi:hypothetical protein